MAAPETSPKPRARLKRKAEVVRHKGGECERCGEPRLAALTLHHPEGVRRSLPNGRASSKSSTLWSVPFTDELWAEINACELLCFNCHQVHHSTAHGGMTADELLDKDYTKNVSTPKAKTRRSRKGKP